MEWTTKKQISRDNIYVGKRVWAWYLDFSPMYRKTKYLVPPSEFYVVTTSYRLESPFMTLPDGETSLYLPSYCLDSNGGIFETEEDAVYCWNEALNSTIKDIEEEAAFYKHEVLEGDMEYRFTKNWKSCPKENMEINTLSEKEIFKDGVQKYYVATTDPWWRRMDIPWVIRSTTRKLNGGSYPIYVGKHYIGKDSPKGLIYEFFPSYQDIALYYSNIEKYRIADTVDSWKEMLVENVRRLKI